MNARERFHATFNYGSPDRMFLWPQWAFPDKRALRDGCSKADIEREVMTKVPRLAAEGGFSPMVDHSVPPNVPFANFKYYMDLVRESCPARR